MCYIHKSVSIPPKNFLDISLDKIPPDAQKDRGECRKISFYVHFFQLHLYSLVMHMYTNSLNYFWVGNFASHLYKTT